MSDTKLYLIWVIELSNGTFFWQIREAEKRVLASSSIISNHDEVFEEALMLGERFNMGLVESYRDKRGELSDKRRKT